MRPTTRRASSSARNVIAAGDATLGRRGFHFESGCRRLHTEIQLDGWPSSCRLPGPATGSSTPPRKPGTRSLTWPRLHRMSSRSCTTISPMAASPCRWSTCPHVAHAPARQGTRGEGGWGARLGRCGVCAGRRDGTRSRMPSGRPSRWLGRGRRQVSGSIPGAEGDAVRGLAARVMECAAGGRPYSGCEASFARAGMAGREARVGRDAGSTGQPSVIRRVGTALPGAALKRPGRATPARAPAAVGVAPATHSNLAAHAGGTIWAGVVSS